MRLDRRSSMRLSTRVPSHAGITMAGRSRRTPSGPADQPQARVGEPASVRIGGRCGAISVNEHDATRAAPATSALS